MYIHSHSVVYHLESFETVLRLLVISVRIGSGDHTPVYLQPVQYLHTLYNFPAANELRTSL